MKNQNTSIKVSTAIYQWLCELSGKMQVETGKRVSINEALKKLKEEKTKKLSDFAGAWKMSEKEEEEFFKTLKKGWEGWKSSA